LLFPPRGNRLMHADREATDTDRVALGAGARFTIFPVAKSTQVREIYSMVAPDRFWGLEVTLSVGSFSDLAC
jgi:hypothetical protein